MLEEIPSQRNRHRVFRLQAIAGDEKFNSVLNLDPQSSRELRDLIADADNIVNLDEFLDGPFEPKHRFKSQTRFSDGSFPVFYSSLEPDTAEAEVMHWVPLGIGNPQDPRTVYYRSFSWEFFGVEKDLRSKVSDWPDLIGPSDYTFCNQLGNEAKEMQIDGLLTRSARYEGSNLPIFNRDSVARPELGSVISMTYDPTTGNVRVKHIDE